jgi:hypothetical protein
MPVVVSNIVSSVINLLSQVPGIATQIYASNRIQQHVQDAFLLELEEMWWPDYMCFIGPIPLDGTTGGLTQDLTGPLATITEYRDIAAVYHSSHNRKLRELPQSINPTLLSSGLSAFYIAPDYTVHGRPFKVYPMNSATSVVVWARQRPKLPLSLTDTLYLDQLLLQYDACWMYAVDDGTIPAQVNKFQVLAQNRRRMIKAGYGQHPIELDPRFPSDADIFGGGSGSDSFTYFVLDKDPLA